MYQNALLDKKTLVICHMWIEPVAPQQKKTTVIYARTKQI